MSTVTIPQILAGYRAADLRFDEVLAAPATPRPHWSRLFSELLEMEPEQIRSRLAEAERLIRESGITYNVYADPQGLDRPWDLDVLPMLIPPAEWEAIEAGIVQRAQLFNRVLQDIYGPQDLLREGLLPPGLVLGHSGFLRPAHGVAVPGGIHLHIFAAELGRSPDGRWWVMADRTQAPSGAGYALENRLVVSRAFPDLFRELHVQHLAAFFAGLRDSLGHFAPRGDGPTLTVVLTPGPFNETYFEHAFLARYLGFPLVEGGDLVVRDGRVWLKTIDGLARVHAILRRQDDDYCDPLELRADSALGIAGLTDCVRRGSVLVANALGSGVLEGGTLLGFLPRLCEHLMGEPLKMPSIATWWCGEPAALQDALSRVHSLVFKTADPAHRFEPIFGQDLDEKGLAAFRTRITAHPERFIAQELVRMSQAPVLDRAHPRRIAARGVGLRVFAIATPSGYRVMPGGLTRVAASADARVVSMQRGGGSKDTWVISDNPIDTSLTLLQNRVSPADLVRSGTRISSRIAENLFWFGRYAERCEDAARLLRVALGQSLLDADDNAVEPIHALVEGFGIELDGDNPDRALRSAATRDEDPCGLGANLRQLSRIAFTLRDRMSLDNWRSINRLLQDPAFGRSTSLGETLNFLDAAIRGLMTLSGFALDGMTRDNAWRFLSAGRRIERLSFTSLSLLTAIESGRGSGLTWLLELADSIVTYRSRYMSRPEWLPVLDLLVLDEANPRSVAFQVHGLLGVLDRLEGAYRDFSGKGFREAAQLLGKLDPARDFAELYNTQDEPPRPAAFRSAAFRLTGRSTPEPGDTIAESTDLVATLGQIRTAAFALSDELRRRFFAHAEGTLA